MTDEPSGSNDKSASNSSSSLNGQLRTPSSSPDRDVPADKPNGHPPQANGLNSDESKTSHVGGSVNGGKPTSNGSAVGSPPQGFADAKELPELSIPRDRRRSSIEKVGSPLSGKLERERILKLSPAKIQELTSAPMSLPLRPASPIPEDLPKLSESAIIDGDNPSSPERVITATSHRREGPRDEVLSPPLKSAPLRPSDKTSPREPGSAIDTDGLKEPSSTTRSRRPSLSSRTVSTPVIRRKQSSTRSAGPARDPAAGAQKPGRPTPLKLEDEKNSRPNGSLQPNAPPQPPASPMPPTIPLPPMSVPTYLQLELSSEKPSPLYIHRSTTADFPYESAKIKFERLMNFLLLPPQLEQILWFGALACLDAWLYTFTILPLRFFRAIWIVAEWWAQNAAKEANDLAGFVYTGLGRMWRRRNQPIFSASATPIEEKPRPDMAPVTQTTTPISVSALRDDGPVQRRLPDQHRGRKPPYRHRRTKSTPSSLQPSHKADILKGLLVLASCVILMRFDASRMYHGIRGQAAIKLYVIYNVLEVCDRLFSALGQDVLECLFSRETLERDADGRSKILRPFGMFLLALTYNVIHATALFYQVITLNVAVNSYSNALLTLLMSNQFVEIKGTVFKKFEKENLFQLTCADVVERFQLWLMLMIIAMRNIIEVGGLSINHDNMPGNTGSNTFGSNATGTPFRSSGIIPKSFTILPKWTGQVFGPFLLVLGSEMLVDWLKHAYITKFNNTKPNIYGRFLDVLAKDYYTHAFADQNLTKRLGLPVLPLSCLFIRALVQTYHMFLATHMPLPIPSSATSLAESGTSASPATTSALANIDQIFRRALGRSTFGAGVAGANESNAGFSWWSLDDVIAFTTMVVVFLIAYLILLAAKLVLGMCLLVIARRRYRGMKERERMVVETGGRRVGGWGVVEVDEDKKRWIYVDDPEGMKAAKDRELGLKDGKSKKEIPLGEVGRYNMVAKRIW